MEIAFVDLKAQYKSIKSKIDAAVAEVIDNTSFIGGKKVRSLKQSLVNILV